MSRLDPSRTATHKTLGTIFSQELKPFEVELLLAQVGETPEQNELYRIGFDGSIFDEKRFTVIGGRSESVLSCIRKAINPRAPESPRSLVTMSFFHRAKPTEQKIAVEGLEVAILDRKRSGRKFKRLAQSEARAILS